MKYQGWKGSFIDAYFGNLEKGEWVDINYIHYIWLKVRGFIVRKSYFLIFFLLVNSSCKDAHTNVKLLDINKNISIDYSPTLKNGDTVIVFTDGLKIEVLKTKMNIQSGTSTIKSYKGIVIN